MVAIGSPARRARPVNAEGQSFDLAMDGDGRPLVVTSPDDRPCLTVATAEVHRRRISSPQWRRMTLDDLVEHLAGGVDMVFNPGGPAAVRLSGDFVREALAMSEDEAAELLARKRLTPDPGAGGHRSAMV